MIRRPPRSTQSRSSAASDVYKRQVQHRVAHLVPLDGGLERDRVRLVHELGRVHPDDDEDVAVLLLEPAQLVQDMQAVDAAEGPEVEQDDLAAQVGQREVTAAGVQPAASEQLRRANAG